MTTHFREEPKIGPSADVLCFAVGEKWGCVYTDEDLASLKGTHSYDIVCSFGSRVERRYVK
jgi:alanine racemase